MLSMSSESGREDQTTSSDGNDNAAIEQQAESISWKTFDSNVNTSKESLAIDCNFELKMYYREPNLPRKDDPLAQNIPQLRRWQ